MALTDHDTVAGLHEARIAGSELNVTVIAGVELSAHIEKTTYTDHETNVHLLGYFVDTSSAGFLKFLKRQRDVRDERNLILVDMLRRLGMPLQIEDVQAESIGESVGRPHFAAALVRSGHAESIQDAFSRYLGAGSPTHASRRDLPAEQAIAAIAAAGGVAVWAHPFTGGSRSDSNVRETLRVLVGLGLGGIESSYGEYSPEVREKLISLAREHKVVPTGGSDYHGAFKPGLSIGKGHGDLDVPVAVLEELRDRRMRR